MFTKLCIFLFISITVKQLPNAYAQQLPQSPCPQFFTYQHDGFGYFGELKFANWPLGESEVRVHLSQHGVSNSNYHGRLRPYPNEGVNVKNILEMKGATFRIDFADPGNPPKVTMLSLNGQQLCSGEEFPPPSSWGELSYRVVSYRASFNASISYATSAITYYNTSSKYTSEAIKPCNIKQDDSGENKNCGSQSDNN